MTLPKNIGEVDFFAITEEEMIELFKVDPDLFFEITEHEDYNPNDEDEMKFDYIEPSDEEE